MKPTARKLVRISYRVERVLGENVYLLVLAAFIGVLGGFGAVAFRELIDLIRGISFQGGTSVKELGETSWYWIVLPPTIGGMVVGPLIYFLAREAKGHGIPEVMNSVSNSGGRIRRRVVAIKTLASAITIGTGGSVGREGPIVQIGAGVGSTMGQALGFEGNRLITMLGCGAAAGMAATFNAPIAGVILTVEVIIGSATLSVLSPLVVASVAGTVVTHAFYGEETFIAVPDYALINPAVELPLYIVLGVAAGLVAFMFTKGICVMEDLWENLPLPGWATPMLGGAAVGGMALVFPQLLGVGYETLDNALHGRETLWVLASLVLVKIVASGTSLGSGGSGGVFAPALFVGACLGGAFGMAVEQILPGQTAGSGAYALVGMGAVLAGATHAPISAIIMLFELTTTYTIILPLMLSCIIALVISTRLMPTSIFTTRLLRRGVRLRGSAEEELMRNTTVRRVMKAFPDTLGPATPIGEVVRKALSGSHPHQYVVDGSGKLLGVITLRRLKVAFGDSGMEDALLVAADVMKTPVTSVKLEDTLDVAMSHISRQDLEMLPVVDEQVLVGCVSQRDVMLYFETEIMKERGLGMKFVRDDERQTDDFVELPEGHVVKSIAVAGFIVGKNLRELDLRATAAVNVVAVRQLTPEGEQKVPLDPGAPLLREQVLTVTGREVDVESFVKVVKEDD